MYRRYLLISIFLFSVVFTSCVSKKKFLEMQDGRLKAEELSRKLTSENADKAARIIALTEDFESMKNELLESNRIKDHYIDSLMGTVNDLKNNLNVQQETLQETSFNLDFEKQRLSDAIKTKDKTITALQNKVEQMDGMISEKNATIDQKNFDLQRLTDEAKVLEEKIKSGEGKLNELMGELEKVKGETGTLQKQLKEKDATILRLQNNVKLLKQEIGQ